MEYFKITTEGRKKTTKTVFALTCPHRKANKNLSFNCICLMYTIAHKHNLRNERNNSLSSSRLNLSLRIYWENFIVWATTE